MDESFPAQQKVVSTNVYVSLAKEWLGQHVK